MKRKITTFVAIVAAAVLAGEISVRAFGFVDFPVYDVGGEIGYLPKGNQAGAFLNRNDWYFNNKSMPIAADWSPALRPSILLIGNSVVMGGNPYRQQEKLAPRIQKLLGASPVVWPIAAGGWTQVNQIAYLDKHPEVVASPNYTAWEYMHGGLGGATPWPGQYVFPSHKPILATWYVFRRYILPAIVPINDSELPAIGAPQSANVQRFDDAVGTFVARDSRPGRGIIWLYPTAAQLRSSGTPGGWLPERGQIESIANKHGLRLVDIAAKPEWNSSLYLPDGVHPTVEGIGVLASILVEEFRKDGIK